MLVYNYIDIKMHVHTTLHLGPISIFSYIDVYMHIHTVMHAFIQCVYTHTERCKYTYKLYTLLQRIVDSQ